MGLLVSLEETKKFLRVDMDDEDTYIGSLIPLAQEYCENYMRKSLEDQEDIPVSIKQAILLLAGYFYENREETESNIPEVVHTLLLPYREAAW